MPPSTSVDTSTSPNLPIRPTPVPWNRGALQGVPLRGDRAQPQHQAGAGSQNRWRNSPSRRTLSSYGRTLAAQASSSRHHHTAELVERHARVRHISTTPPEIRDPMPGPQHSQHGGGGPQCASSGRPDACKRSATCATREETPLGFGRWRHRPPRIAAPSTSSK